MTTTRTGLGVILALTLMVCGDPIVGAGRPARLRPANKPHDDPERDRDRKIERKIDRKIERNIDRDIVALLQAQTEAWNRGDLEGFMAGYWKSEQTTFAGSTGVFRGWQALLERYRRNYPDRATMGNLKFSALEVTALAPDAAFVLGRWHLERASGPVGGVFSLVIRKFPEGWRIVHDHTSAVEKVTPKPAS